jgi:hypothetical protein
LITTSEPSVLGDTDKAQNGAFALSEHLPWDEVSVVLHDGEQNLVSFLQVDRGRGGVGSDESITSEAQE